MKHTKKILALLLAMIMLLGMVACGGSNSTDNKAPENGTTVNPDNSGSTTPDNGNANTETQEDYNGKLVSEGMMELKFAGLFSIELFKGGYRMISAGTGGHKYLVVPEGMTVPADLEDGIFVLQMPVENVYSASTSLISLADAIGALDRIKLCATEYDSWQVPAVIAQMDAGKLAYSGSYKEPDYELMTAHAIQFHIDTTMVDSYPEVLDKFYELGIPSMVEDSSKETHPLGRVEWVKLLGALFGLEAEADAYFAEQIERFNAAYTEESLGKTVAIGYITTNGKCYARNGGDYIAQLAEMAGGDYICADMNPDKGGNTSMTFEEWYNLFVDADYLFYYNLGEKFYTVEDMIAYNPLFADFKAVQNGNVWITCEGFSQKSADIVGVITDMHTVLSSDDNTVTTDYIVKIS